MLLRTYSKEEVNDLIQKEVGEIKNELIQYIGKLEQKNRILEETLEQMKITYDKNLNNEICKVKNEFEEKLNNKTQDINKLEQIDIIESKINILIDEYKIFRNGIEETIEQIKKDYNNNLNDEINNVKSEFEEKLNNIVNKIENMEDHILIGYRFEGNDNGNPKFIPVFVNKNCDWEKLLSNLINKNIGYGFTGCKLYINKLNKLPNIKYFDCCVLLGIEIIDNNENEIIKLRPPKRWDLQNWISLHTNKDKIKKIYTICKESNIKFVINGQDKINCISIKEYFENDYIKGKIINEEF